ncbi:cyclin D1/2/4 [Spatholobus suberectus]|nr:cyclin D1/2/4 [Spatholobus suberectus]
MSMLASPFQLLEVNIISAQDLAPVSKSIKAYAVAWLNPERKLTTQIDPDGHNNPTWNEKFVFRVDDDFLNADDSTIMIEIYASAWLRDVLIGTVGVLAANLLPRSNTRKSKVRFVALQVRRPSGRPQGILNIGVNLVDATMRSMPMYSELSASAVGFWDTMDPKKQKLPPNQTPQNETNDSNFKLLTLQRSASEKNDSTINDYTYNIYPKQNGYGDGGDCQAGSKLGMPITKKGVIMNLNGSLCSDVGPSPSVVAAAIAKGLYPLPLPAPRKPGNLVFEGLPETEEGEEGPNKKIDRWRAGEMPAVYDHLGQNQKKVKHSIPKGKGQNQRRGGGRGNGGLFSCFGTAMGCEFSITCGGGNANRKKRYEGGSKAHLTAASDLTYDESYI